MKIAHLILSKGYAGTERYVCDLANFQSKKNEVYIIKLKSDNTELFKKNTSNKIKIFEISNFLKTITLKKIIKNISPQIIHTHLGTASRLLTKKWGDYKIITTMHMNYNKKYFKDVDGIICSNNYQFQNIKKQFKGKVFKSFLWPVEKLKTNGINMKKKLGLTKDTYVFGSIGRFHKQKGFDFLAKTFDKINLRKTVLILVGNDHVELAKKYQHNKNIICLGHVDCPSDLYQVFNAAVFASRWESFGITLLEAMLHKLPIISTVHEGNKDWINKFNIKRIRVDEEADLKKSFISFRKLTPKKIKYNLKDFNYKTICGNIENFYKQL